MIHRGSRRVDPCALEIEEHLSASKLQVYWLHVHARQSAGRFAGFTEQETLLLCSQIRTKSCFNQDSSYLWSGCHDAFADCFCRVVVFCPVKQHRHSGAPVCRVLLCACVHCWCQQCLTCRSFTKALTKHTASSAPAVSRVNRTGFICFDTPHTPRVYTRLNSTA